MCYDYDGFPEFCDSSTRTARKEHRCCECRQTIPAGSQYEYVAGKWDGEFSAYKTCQSCVALRGMVQKIEIRNGCLTDNVPCFTELYEAAYELRLFPRVERERMYA